MIDNELVNELAQFILLFKIEPSGFNISKHRLVSARQANSLKSQQTDYFIQEFIMPKNNATMFLTRSKDDIYKQVML